MLRSWGMGLARDISGDVVEVASSTAYLRFNRNSQVPELDRSIGWRYMLRSLMATVSEIWQHQLFVWNLACGGQQCTLGLQAILGCCGK